MEILPLNVDDDRSMADAYAVECAANRNERPGWTPLGLAAWVLGWRADDGWRNHLVGAWDGDELLGFAAGMKASDTPDTTWIFVWVAPKNQRAGIGTALVREVEATSLECTERFTSSAYRPAAGEMDRLTEHFSQPLGYLLATTETVVELDLRTAHLPSPRVAGGYAISTHINGVPEHLWEQVGRIKGLVDAEAPHGDLAWAETPVSAAEYASEIELWMAQGRTVFESIAIDSQGDVVAWTCVLVAADAARAAQIEGTLVVTAHRGHGLGAAVKLACLREARRLSSVQKVRTSSDDKNTWMRAINTQLGFVPVETEIIIRKNRALD